MLELCVTQCSAVKAYPRLLCHFISAVLLLEDGQKSHLWKIETLANGCDACCKFMMPSLNTEVILQHELIQVGALMTFCWLMFAVLSSSVVL